MLEKPSFRNAVAKGRRCVVIADGYVCDPPLITIIIIVNFSDFLSGIEEKVNVNHTSYTSLIMGHLRR